MEIYLMIVETYLAIAFTLFIIYMKNAKDIWKEVKRDNKIWKEEVREYFRYLMK